MEAEYQNGECTILSDIYSREIFDSCVLHHITDAIERIRREKPENLEASLDLFEHPEIMSSLEIFPLGVKLFYEDLCINEDGQLREKGLEKARLLNQYFKQKTI